MNNTKFSIFLSYDTSCEENLLSTIKKIIGDSPLFPVDIHILSKGISSDAKAKITSLGSFKYVFDDLSGKIDLEYDFYKFAIDVISDAKKAVYIDVNSTIEYNINKLLSCDLGEYYVAAYHDASFDCEPYATYTEKVLGISHYVYTNDDILIFNLANSKNKGAYERFLTYKNFASFGVNEAEALFNLVYKDRILIIGNTFGEIYGDSVSEIENEDGFFKKWCREKRDKNRLLIEEKIADFEKRGIFDKDVEDDVPGRMIMPGEIEYVKKKPIQKLKRKIAFKMAKKFYYKLEKKKLVKINEKVEGLENLAFLNSGAVITCNHFNAMDSFAMHWVYLKSKHKKRKLYRVIREGNYTSFPGFFGFLMRNFYTLPLSSNHKTMRKFLEGVNELLKNGDFVLVYPEQSMWWNYRKPKPLKPGAFSFAEKNGVPVLPIFITMRDTEILGPDGYYVQEYKMHIGKPIYPDKEKGSRENIDEMIKENERVWKSFYEREYQMPLEYTTEIEKAEL